MADKEPQKLSDEDQRPCRCDNCGLVTTIDHTAPLWAIPQLFARLDAGGEVPAGACQSCGALAYLITDKVKLELSEDDIGNLGGWALFASSRTSNDNEKVDARDLIERLLRAGIELKLNIKALGERNTGENTGQDSQDVSSEDQRAGDTGEPSGDDDRPVPG